MQNSRTLRFSEMAAMVEHKAGRRAQELRAHALTLALNLAEQFPLADVTWFAQGGNESNYEKSLRKLFSLYATPEDIPDVRETMHIALKHNARVAWEAWEQRHETRGAPVDDEGLRRYLSSDLVRLQLRRAP